MDKQTAIDLLDNLLGMVEDNHESDYDTAIKMGIDALQSNAPNALSALDCVDRQAALEAMDTWDKFGCDPDGKLVKYDDDKHYIPYVNYEDMVHAIKHLPSVQPQRMKGKWIDQKGGGCCCSECGRYALDEPDGNFIHVAVKSNFCPNCGADMRGGQDE